MKKVIVFFNSEPSVIEIMADEATNILRKYPSGESIELKIMIARISSLTGDHQYFSVASDRHLLLDEILYAINKLSLN
ncbi:hypothetical protein [Entomohabitans teleogrylli]|uniref:hypothetical protein n=1 Tax=Entomohabitans teleogrylli TaxID=1384589 RepID=UPI0008FC9A57|nr:hypothetical protein [Entomohabitans teleogrylli]